MIGKRRGPGGDLWWVGEVIEEMVLQRRMNGHKAPISTNKMQKSVGDILKSRVFVYQREVCTSKEMKCCTSGSPLVNQKSVVVE